MGLGLVYLLAWMVDFYGFSWDGWTVYFWNRASQPGFQWPFQDSSIFSRESQPKPFKNVTVIGCGGRPKIYLPTWMVDFLWVFMWVNIRRIVPWICQKNNFWNKFGDTTSASAEKFLQILENSLLTTGEGRKGKKLVAMYAETFDGLVGKNVYSYATLKPAVVFLAYAPENYHGTWKWTPQTRDSYWKAPLSDSMLSFGGVSAVAFGVS